MRLEALPIGENPPHEVNVVVEYEVHKASGALIVDRFLYTAMRYPGNYGFIPHTLSEDGDPCDVIIANHRGLLPGSVIAVRPVGVLKMQDEAGGDEKIVAVPVPKVSRRYENVHEYTDLPEITRQQIQHFFEHYKDLEGGKWVKVTGWGNAEEARRCISEAIERFASQKG
jgi:inorganic pyrophosphatase